MRLRAFSKRYLIRVESNGPVAIAMPSSTRIVHSVLRTLCYVTDECNAKEGYKVFPRHFPYFCRRGDAWQGSHEDHGSWVCCTIKIFIWAVINHHCHSASNTRGQSSDWTWPSLSACFQGIGTGVIGPTADDCMPDCRISPNSIAICSIECGYNTLVSSRHEF